MIITKNSSNKHFSYTLTDNNVVHIYSHILDNEIIDVTSKVINAFYYQENKSNNVIIDKDKTTQKLLPFYDEMIKNAVNRMWGNNTLGLDLPKNPQKIIKEFRNQTDINHFYALKVHSLLAYLIPKYWVYMQKSTGIAPDRLTYDLYQIPLNRSSTLNYYAYRGTDRGSYYVPNQFLFGGDMHDSKFYAVKHFLKWANQVYLPKHPVDELKKNGVVFHKKG